MFFTILEGLLQDGPLAQSPRRVLGLLDHGNNLQNFQGEADRTFNSKA